MANFKKKKMKDGTEINLCLKHNFPLAFYNGTYDCAVCLEKGETDK